MESLLSPPGYGSRYPKENIAIGSTNQNPYSPPHHSSEVDVPSVSQSVVGPRRGPAIAIAVGSLVGLMIGILLVLQRFPIGFLGFIPGAVCGGVYYRVASASLPVDATARRRRYLYAAIAFTSLPTLVGVTTGMRAQGLTMTIWAVLIGAAFALGILVSGDRRPVRVG